MYFNVSFMQSESVFCNNIAHAENEEAVKKHYSKYAWCSVSPASEYDIEAAKMKGMPMIEIGGKDEDTQKNVIRL